MPVCVACVRARHPQGLRHFVAHFEMITGQRRVGLAPKTAPLTVGEQLARNRASCAAVSTCIGQEHYSSKDNRCVPPEYAAEPIAQRPQIPVHSVHRAHH